MAVMEPDVEGSLVKVDHLTPDQIRDIDETVLAGILRRILETSDQPHEDSVARFNNYA